MKTLSAKLALLAVFLSIPVMSGCGSTEATRRTLHYDGEAAKHSEKTANEIAADPKATPTIKAKAESIAEEQRNIQVSVPLLKAEIGDADPATTPPYTPRQHAETNEQARKELADKAGLIDGVWNFVQTGAGKLTMAIFGTAVGGLVVGWLRTKLWSGKLWDYVKIAGSLIGKDSEMKADFAKKASDRGVQANVFKVVEALPVPTPSIPAPSEEQDEEVVVVGEAKPPTP